jgi:hypothetical protein
MTRNRFLLVICCVALPAACSYELARMAPPGGIGLSTPADLLTYTERPGMPAYCRTPLTLLGEVQKLVQSDQAKTGASATMVAGPSLRIVSPISSDADCVDEYVAEIWTERIKRSATNYHVRAFGRVARACSAEVFEAEDLVAVRAAARLVDQKLDDIFQRCR